MAKEESKSGNAAVEAAKQKMRDAQKEYAALTEKGTLKGCKKAIMKAYCEIYAEKGMDKAAKKAAFIAAINEAVADLKRGA